MARFNNGWVKLWRGAVDSDLFDNDKLWKIWCWLLTAATWHPQKKILDGRQVELPPGTVITGFFEISNAVGCSKSTVHKWIKYLEKTERIANDPRKEGSVISILNWKTYQSEEEKSEIENEEKANEVRTRSERAPNPNEESKKERRDISREEIQKCIAVWGKTLKRMEVVKNPQLDEVEITRLVQRYGFEKTELALLGAGFEEASENYNPKKHCYVSRLNKIEMFEKFVNLGAQNRPSEEKTVEWNLARFEAC